MRCHQRRELLEGSGVNPAPGQRNQHLDRPVRIGGRFSRCRLPQVKGGKNAGSLRDRRGAGGRSGLQGQQGQIVKGIDGHQPGRVYALGSPGPAGAGTNPHGDPLLISEEAYEVLSGEDVAARIDQESESFAMQHSQLARIRPRRTDPIFGKKGVGGRTREDGFGRDGREVGGDGDYERERVGRGGMANALNHTKESGDDDRANAGGRRPPPVAAGRGDR